MEMTGVGEAAQFLNIAISGAGTAANLGFEALRLSGSFAHFTMHELKKFVMFLTSTIKNQTNLRAGEVKMKDLISQCNKSKGKLGLISIDESIGDVFAQYCKNNGLSYSRLTDVNREDGRFEVVYNAGGSEITLFEKFMRENGTLAVPYSFEEYVNNATDERIMEIEKELSQKPDILNDFTQAEKNVKVRDIQPDNVECIKFDGSQIVAATPDFCEFTLLDATGNRFYMDVKREDIEKTGENEFSILLDKGKKHSVSTRMGFVKNQDNTYTDVRSERQPQENFLCDTALIRSISEIERNYKKKNEVLTQGFYNSKDPQSNVVRFPADVVEKATEKATEKITGKSIPRR